MYQTLLHDAKHLLAKTLNNHIMKNQNLFKSIKMVTLLLLLFSCSNDIELESEIIDKPAKEELTSSRSSDKFECLALTIYATYNFPYEIINGVTILISEEEQNTIKENFRDEMSQYFTIFQIIDDENCSNLESWIVNCSEYQAYLLIKAGTNNEEANNGELGGDPNPNGNMDGNPYCN